MRGTILIVEDNALSLELARDVLESQGFLVESASDADECLAALQRSRPDLILMDIQLPGTDGLELTRGLRANSSTQDILIVAMTAHAMPEDAGRVTDAGCDGYLIKPIQTRSFAAQIEGFIAAGRAPGAGTMPAALAGGERASPSPPEAEDIPETTP